LKALVVDDEPDVLGAAIELFKAMGYDVISATNGLEAVELAKSHPALDVLFTDVLMPGLDGVSVALEVRKLNPELKVVLVSGFPASALTTAGATDFDLLLKPYSRSQVAKLLRK
jgi:CheY-like chemotaxis protein